MLLDESETASLLVPLTPLEAFRRDARQATGGYVAPDALASWLGVAVMLGRHAECDGEERSRLEPELLDLLQHSTADRRVPDGDIGALARALADIAEDAGALHLAVSILALTESIHAEDILE